MSYKKSTSALHGQAQVSEDEDNEEEDDEDDDEDKGEGIDENPRKGSDVIMENLASVEAFNFLPSMNINKSKAILESQRSQTNDVMMNDTSETLTDCT